MSGATIMHADLIARLEAATKEDNALDVLCEVALFQPDDQVVSVRANFAGTKVIYTDHEGKEETCWAVPWSDPVIKATTIAALRAQARHD